MAIENRIFEALKEVYPGKSHHFFSQLEKTSGIKASSWRHVYYGHQRATSEMIQFACRCAPNYAFWIATGAKPENALEHARPSLDYDALIRQDPKEWGKDEAEFIAKTIATKRELAYAN